MAVTLESSRLKLHRAQAHFKTLERRIEAFRRRPCYKRNVQRIISEIDPQTGEEVFKLQWRPRKVPLSFAPLIGDTLYNLRSALDHLAWSLVEDNGRQPGRHTQFPISEVGGNFTTRMKGCLKGMSAEAKVMVKSVQPCYRGNSTPFQHLDWLEKLSNIDKHQHLHLAVGATGGGLFDSGFSISASQRGDIFIHTGPVNDGTVLARIPQSQNHVNFNPIFDIAFGPKSPASGQSVGMTLRIIYFVVEDIIDKSDHQFFT